MNTVTHTAKMLFHSPGWKSPSPASNSPCGFPLWFWPMDTGRWRLTPKIAKTTLTTPLGLYEFERMLLGLCNAPATIQWLMQRCLGSQVNDTLLIYLNHHFLTCLLKPSPGAGVQKTLEARPQAAAQAVSSSSQK